MRVVTESNFSKAHAALTPRGSCWICHIRFVKKGPRALQKTRDHVIPLSRGGRFLLGNIRFAHALCNERKADGTVTSELVAWCQMEITELIGRNNS